MSGRRGRAVALAMLSLALAAGCNLGGDDDTAATTTTETTVPVTTTSLPPGGRQPTVADPLRVTFAGDSVMAEFAPAMIQALEGTNESTGRFLLAPSLARQASTRVSWNQELTEHDPELIVLLVGFWEDKVIGEEASAQPGWARAYRNQVVEPFLDLVTQNGAKVLWIGMAAAREPLATARFARMNFVYNEVAEARDDVEFLPAGQYLSGPDGAYTDVLPSPVTGQPVRIRRTDGLHICPGGIDLLGAPVLEAVTQQWNITAAYGWQQGTWREPPLLHAPEECPAPA